MSRNSLTIGSRTTFLIALSAVVGCSSGNGLTNPTTTDSSTSTPDSSATTTNDVGNPGDTNVTTSATDSGVPPTDTNLATDTAVAATDTAIAATDTYVTKPDSTVATDTSVADSQKTDTTVTDSQKADTADATGDSGPAGAPPQLTVVGNHFVDPTGKTVILRGVSIESLYDQSTTGLGLDGLFDKITNTNDIAGTSPGWYPRIVRLPVDVYGTSNTYFTDPNYVTKYLKPAVDYVTSKGLYAIVDLHYVDNPYDTTIGPNVTKFWTAVAPVFKGYSNVFYEVFNESNQQDTWETYKPTMQAWVTLIRGLAPNNIILAGSPAWDQTMADTATDPLTGTNIAYTVHMYEQHYANSWNVQQAQTAAAAHPIVMTEWGYCAPGNPLDPGCTSQPGSGGAGLNTIYGTPMLTWLEGLNGSWTAWCASNSWEPVMFGTDWSLLVGKDDMGGFVKDWLYTHRNE